MKHYAVICKRNRQGVVSNKRVLISVFLKISQARNNSFASLGVDFLEMKKLPPLLISSLFLLSLKRRNQQVKRKEREIRVLVVGLDNSGKTTIVKKINGEDISKISPTLGFNISSLHLNDYRLNVWDVGGQKTLRTFWRNYFEKTDALVWVVDSTDVARLQDCKNELDVILKEEKLVDASLLVLANKQDVEGAMSGRDIAEALGLVSIGSSNSVSVSSSEVLSGMTSNSSKRRWRVQKCSATTGDGILDGFEFITEDVGSRMFTLD